jgi:hypothetical protein
MSQRGVCLSAFLAMGLAPCLVGCVVVPPHDGLARVRVGDVVKRVKCELAEVISNKAQEKTPDGRRPFVFLGNWAAKIHLTIAVDDTANLNPGATISNPLDKTVATALIPTTTEMFSLGLGAGFTTEAVRQEDIEFLVSFSDMIPEFQNTPRRDYLYNDCKLPQGLLLESDLGLWSLVNAALEPVESGVLYQGNNIGPPGTSAVAIPPGQLNNIPEQLEKFRAVSGELPKPPPDQPLSALANPQNRTQFNALITKFQFSNDTLTSSEVQLQGKNLANVQTAKAILANSAEATTDETRTQAIINNIVKPLYGIASTSLDASCLPKLTQSQFKAIALSAEVSADVIKVDNAVDDTISGDALVAVRKDMNNVIDATNTMLSQMKACKTPKKPPGPPQYDPIDLISETVNFYITASGSVTPGWKLVKVTAPLAPTFFSGSRKDTNTIILAMGRPAPSSSGGITGSSAMDLQILSSTLSQAVRPATIVP